MAEQEKRQGTFDQSCPPLIKNHDLTENAPRAIQADLVKRPPRGKKQASHVYYYMNDFVRREWTEDDWRMHHWIYHRLTEDVDKQIGIVLDALRDAGLDESTFVDLHE